MTAAEICKDLESLSYFLGFSPQHLFSLVGNANNLYVDIKIPKNSKPNEFRVISIPNAELKGVQREIYDKILSDVEVHECVYSYVKGRSVVGAAKEFCPGKAVLRLDVRDFFPSVSDRRIFGLFRKLGYESKACYLFTKLCTKAGSLAQGAPTSPMLSNIIFYEIDKRLSKLAESWKLKYLRYSDDVFFYKDKNFNHPKLTSKIIDIIDVGGFIVNENKIRYYPKGLPRITLGLLTHGEVPRIPGGKRKAYRSAFFRASRNIHWAYENRDRLKGMLEWYKLVHGRDSNYIEYFHVFNNINKLKLHNEYKSR